MITLVDIEPVKPAVRVVTADEAERQTLYRLIRYPDETPEAFVFSVNCAVDSAPIWRWVDLRGCKWVDPELPAVAVEPGTRITLQA